MLQGFAAIIKRATVGEGGGVLYGRGSYPACRVNSFFEVIQDLAPGLLPEQQHGVVESQPGLEE